MGPVAAAATSSRLGRATPLMKPMVPIRPATRATSGRASGQYRSMDPTGAKSTGISRLWPSSSVMRLRWLTSRNTLGLKA